VAGGGAAIRLAKATLRFGPRLIWQDLDLDIAAGESVAVLGPNGAGKTTLLKVLLGLVPLTAGKVTIGGAPPRRGSSAVGYVAQQRAFDPDLPIRGRDLVQLGLDGHRLGLPWGRNPAVDDAIAAVGAESYANAPVGRLSGGEQQRLRIAQALVGRPRLLLCDEPLLSLDPSSQETVVSLVDNYHVEHGTTVVFVTHEINPVIGFIDRVLYVAGGRWLAGRPDEVLTSEKLSHLYGSRIDVVRVGERIVVVGEAGEGVHHSHSAH
jgi:zinc/manganese transport system ATP-binding protein